MHVIRYRFRILIVPRCRYRYRYRYSIPVSERAKPISLSLPVYCFVFHIFRIPFSSFLSSLLCFLSTPKFSPHFRQCSPLSSVTLLRFHLFSLSSYLFLPIVLSLPKFPHTCIIPLSRRRVSSPFSLSIYFFHSSFLFSSSRSLLLLLSIISLTFLSRSLTLSFSFCLPLSVALSPAISLSKFFSIPLSFS